MESSMEKKKRITKAAMEVFIAETEKSFDSEDAIPECWQALREFIGLPRLTDRDVLVEQIAVLRKEVASCADGSKEELAARRALLALESDLLELDLATAKKAGFDEAVGSFFGGGGTGEQSAD